MKSTIHKDNWYLIFPVFEGKSEYRYDISNLSNGILLFGVFFLMEKLGSQEN